MRVFQVALPHFYQIDSRDQAALLSQMTTLFAGPLGHCRFLTLVMPASLEKLAQARRRLALGRRHDWARRGLLEEVRLINAWAGRGQIRQARHYLVDFDDAVTAGDLAHWLVKGQAALPPLPLRGDYVEQPDHMAPVRQDRHGRWRPDHSRYHYAVLASYQLTRTWDWRQPLAGLITGASGPLAISIDCRKLHPERVTQAADFWLEMAHNGQDRAAHLARGEAELALTVHDERVHHVRVLFMLLDKNLTSLRARRDSLLQTGSQYLKLDRLLGYQAAAAQMFGPTARPPGLPSGHFNTLSRAPAVFAGMWGVGRAQSERGYYIGIAVDEVAPHVHYLEWRENDPFHGIILGRTGKGKTVGAQALAWRLAEQDVQVILLEPQGHSRRLLALAAAAGVDAADVAYNKLSYETTRLNILDVVYAHATDQYDHVLTLLGLLLDPLGQRPRHFTNAEIAGLRRALALTYARYDWAAELLVDHTLTPTLSTLCHKLRLVAAETGGASLAPAAVPAGTQMAAAAAALAEEIESLYVYGDYAGAFNCSTNLDLALRQRLILFDFSQVPERRRALFYYATLAGINHQMRRQPRRRAIIVDEVHYMNRASSLMSFLANLVKTGRTYGAAVILIDQDLEAFIGVDGAPAESMAAGLNVAAGQFILNNSTWLVVYGLKRDAAYRLVTQFRAEVLPAHAEFLTRMGSDEGQGKGMAVVRAGGKADTVYWQLRPTEAAHLLGS